MFLNAMAKLLIKTLEDLDTSIECLMTRPGSTLQLSNLFIIVRAWGADGLFLSTVSLVSNHLTPNWDVVFESLPKDLNVCSPCRERSIHPNKPTIKDGDSKLIVESSLVELVRIELWILGKCGVFWLIDATMDAIDSQKKSWWSFAIMISAVATPSFGPYNLVELERRQVSGSLTIRPFAR
jgi:hypothetical protein